MCLVAYHVVGNSIFTIFSDGQKQLITSGNRNRMEKKAKFLANSSNVPCNYF